MIFIYENDGGSGPDLIHFCHACVLVYANMKEIVFFFHILRIVGALAFFALGILGALLPIIPGFPFFILSFLLVYRQILLNKKTA